MNEKSILMTQAQYARHRNKSPQYVGKLAKAGILVMRGRMVDATASDAVLDDKPESATPGQQPTTFAQARLAREIFAAKLKKLEYETRIGKLVPSDEISIKWYTLGRLIRDRVLGISSKLEPQPAAETDVRRVREILDAEVTPALKGLAEDIRNGRA